MAGTLRRSLAAAAILVFSVFGRAEAAAPAGAPPTNLSLPYPQKAPLVVHINGFERVKERLAKMLDALPPEQAKQLKKGIDDGFAQLLKGRSLDGIPKDGRVFVVVHDFAKLVDGEPAVSVIVPATSYKAFKESLLTADERKSIEKAGNSLESVKSSATGDEQTLYMAELKGYVALSPSKETAESYTGKYTWSQSGTMGMDLSTSFLAADVAIYVNMQAINDMYGDQIKQFKGLIDFGLGQAQNMGMIPGLGKKQLDLAKVMIGGLFQGIEDSQGIVLAAEFRPAGLNLRGQIRFADETQTSDLLKPETPTPLVGLTKLPKGLNTYGASKFGKKFSDLGKKFGQEFQAADDDEKGSERIDKLLAEIEASGRIGEVAASSAPEQSMSITGYKTPEKAVTALVKIYEGMESGGKISTIVLKQKPAVKNKAETFRDFTFTEIKLAFDFAATAEALPEPAREVALAQFKLLVKEKTTLWLGTDGKVVVQLHAKDFNAAKKMLGDYLDDTDAIGSDAGFLLARKNLPTDASLLYMLETGQVVSMLVNQVKAVGQAIPGGAGIPQIGSVKPVKGDATYIGIALTLKPQTAGVDLFVPGTSMNVIAKMIAPLLRSVE